MGVLKFQCSGCGSCCRRVGSAIENMKDLGFPYEAKEDGSCEMLDENNQCKVYENRPDVCSVEKMYKILHEPLGKKREEIFRMESEICHKFIEEDGLDEKYKIDLTHYQ